MTHHKHSGKRSRNRSNKRIVVKGRVRFTLYNAAGEKWAVARNFNHDGEWLMSAR
jgi:hypothetical protein